MGCLSRRHNKMWLHCSGASHRTRRGTSRSLGALLIGLSTFVCLGMTSAFQLPAVTVPRRARQVSRGLESAHHLPLRRPSPTAVAGGSAAVDGDGKSAELPLSIYIEHTDRYQVVYNANYVKFLVRAIRHAWPLGDSVLVGMSNVRFKAPARLGDHVVIHTKHVDTQPLKDRQATEPHSPAPSPLFTFTGCPSDDPLPCCAVAGRCRVSCRRSVVRRTPSVSSSRRT